MAPRNPKTVPAPAVVAEPAVEQPELHYLPNPLAITMQTPKTRDEIALRDAVRSQLIAIEAAVMAFVGEKLAEGFAPSEIDELYAVELPLLVAYRADGGRIRVSYDAQIVERQA